MDFGRILERITSPSRPEGLRGIGIGSVVTFSPEAIFALAGASSLPELQVNGTKYVVKEIIKSEKDELRLVVYPFGSDSSQTLSFHPLAAYAKKVTPPETSVPRVPPSTRD